MKGFYKSVYYIGNVCMHLLTVLIVIGIVVSMFVGVPYLLFRGFAHMSSTEALWGTLQCDIGFAALYVFRLLADHAYRKGKAIIESEKSDSVSSEKE